METAVNLYAVLGTVLGVVALAVALAAWVSLLKGKSEDNDHDQ